MKRKFLYQYLLVVIGVCGLSACTANYNSNANLNVNRNANTPVVNISTPSPTENKTHWKVAVCSSRNSEITLQAGPNETDSKTFATWKIGESQRVYELPARVQNLSQIYFQAIGAEAGKPVELCVLYDGRPKKRVAFDEGSEDHTIKASDDDDNDCRCTQ